MNFIEQVFDYVFDTFFDVLKYVSKKEAGSRDLCEQVVSEYDMETARMENEIELDKHRCFICKYPAIKDDLSWISLEGGLWVCPYCLDKRTECDWCHKYEVARNMKGSPAWSKPICSHHCYGGAAASSGHGEVCVDNPSDS